MTRFTKLEQVDKSDQKYPIDTDKLSTRNLKNEEERVALGLPPNTYKKFDIENEIMHLDVRIETAINQIADYKSAMNDRNISMKIDYQLPSRALTTKTKSYRNEHIGSG